MKYFRLIFITLAICFSTAVLAKTKQPKEELIVVQTVSKNRRSFVISKGLKDGVVKGQEIIFANDSVSIVCKVIEVNRDYSLWMPIDSLVNIPFKKDEIISYNSHNYGNVALNIVSDVNNITPALSYDEVYKKFRKNNNLSAKLNFNRGLSQSSSDVSSDNNSTRNGYGASFEYNYRLNYEIELSVGARIDSENYRLNDAQLDIPTNRKLVSIALTYHLMSFSEDQNNFYLTLAAGLGNSKTIVNNATSSGPVFVLPEARLGYLKPLSKKYAAIFEGSVESLNIHEKFPNSAEQVTSILNLKFTVGLRF